MQQSRVTIYGRSGCHLCENVVNLKIEEKLIDNDKELEDLYGQLIPVVHVDGKYFSHFRVDLAEFKAFLEKHRQHQ